MPHDHPDHEHEHEHDHPPAHDRAHVHAHARGAASLERGAGAGKVLFLDAFSGLAGDMLLIVREDGEIVLAEATPEAFRPIARAKALPGVVRAYPALADGFIYLRNGTTLICLDLRPAP